MFEWIFLLEMRKVCLGTTRDIVVHEKSTTNAKEPAAVKIMGKSPGLNLRHQFGYRRISAAGY